MQTCPWLQRPLAVAFYSLSYKINQTSIYAFSAPYPARLFPARRLSPLSPPPPLSLYLSLSLSLSLALSLWGWLVVWVLDVGADFLMGLPSV